MAGQYLDKAVSIIPFNISSAAKSTAFTTNPYDISRFSVSSLQIIITSASTLNCSIAVEVSSNNSNWDEYPSSAVSFIANGSYTWNVGQIGSPWVRLAITFTGGSAKFDCLAFAKMG